MDAAQATAVQRAQAVFHSLHYLRHNARRQEHLVSLGLDLVGRRVLEVGAGIGDHTTFFLDRNCTVLSIEPRPENCELFAAAMQERVRAGYARIGQCRLIRGDVAYIDAKVRETFDIVYCYGLLYHVADPEIALAALARRCEDLLLLETCVSFGAHEEIHPVTEKQGDPSQSYYGGACRPTRPWLWSRLKALFPHVYVPRTQPAHEEFPLDWTPPPPPGLSRAIFVASRRRLANPMLLDHLPVRQTL
jgi:SAM-dependent methyltransferase